MVVRLKAPVEIPTGKIKDNATNSVKRACAKASTNPLVVDISMEPPIPPAAPYDVETLTRMLGECAFPQSTLQKTVVDALKNGSGVVQPLHDKSIASIPENNKSLLLAENEKAVWDATMENCKLGLTDGPRVRPPFPNRLCNEQPKGIRIDVTRKHRNMFFVEELASFCPKKYPKVAAYLAKYKAKIRLVSNLSVLRGSGIATNELSHGPRGHILYMRQADVIQVYARHGKNVLWILADVKSAYKTLPLHPSVLWAFVFALVDPETREKKWFTDLTHVFGSQESEAMWQLFMAVVMHLVKFSEGHQLLRQAMHYVDNIHVPIPPLANGEPDYDSLDTAQKKLFSFLDSIRLKYHEVYLGITPETLGWTFNGEECSDADEVFPVVNFLEERGQVVVIALSAWLQAGEATCSQLDSMLGVFTWASGMWPVLGCFTSIIRNSRSKALKKLKNSASSIALDERACGAIRRLIALLNDALRHGQAQPISPARDPSSRPTIICRTDGSTKHGIGGVNVTSKLFFAIPISREMRRAIQRSEADSSLHIEAFALVVQIILAAGHNEILQVDVDSTNVRDAWLSAKSSVHSVTTLLNIAREHATSLNCTVRVRHIPRVLNFCADSLSNQDIEKFAQHLVSELGLDFQQFSRVHPDIEYLWQKHDASPPQGCPTSRS
jgi:hypothetical protein